MEEVMTVGLDELPDVLTAGEAAKVARCGIKPIYKAIRLQQLYGRRIGAGYRIPKRALVAWLEGRGPDGFALHVLEGRR